MNLLNIRIQSNTFSTLKKFRSTRIGITTICIVLWILYLVLRWYDLFIESVTVFPASLEAVFLLALAILGSLAFIYFVPHILYVVLSFLYVEEDDKIEYVDFRSEELSQLIGEEMWNTNPDQNKIEEMKKELDDLEKLSAKKPLS